ncbi:hypothetical protein CC1G_12779 [Coprinopsis cinerea okayama7|uniref:Uncharacterized protein n=1 Tax=Coprinopsis cinerea (strain Okayama-7 / 130 / ATCC MYA-4618 / FGSC 9003) TaxID=240176 RepID=A8PHT0_COPC7|nr:hypothetical protein CC1G_12779 [Coprinopsis cinerea okayama7\|eukprot:XP_001841459.2 hypothetical protein CC1G_12779 [Coprinopsis cinerea okayama7\
MVSGETARITRSKSAGTRLIRLPSPQAPSRTTRSRKPKVETSATRPKSTRKGKRVVKDESDSDGDYLGAARAPRRPVVMIAEEPIKYVTPPSESEEERHEVYLSTRVSDEDLSGDLDDGVGDDEPAPVPVPSDPTALLQMLRSTVLTASQGVITTYDELLERVKAAFEEEKRLINLQLTVVSETYLARIKAMEAGRATLMDILRREHPDLLSEPSPPTTAPGAHTTTTSNSTLRSTTRASNRKASSSTARPNARPSSSKVVEKT